MLLVESASLAAGAGRIRPAADAPGADTEVRRVTMRWQIRHKLLLGLGMVVGIIALLLVGTIQGLTAFLASAKTSDSKLAELRKAGNFQVIRDSVENEQTVALAAGNCSVRKSSSPRSAWARADRSFRAESVRQCSRSAPAAARSSVRSSQRARM